VAGWVLCVTAQPHNGSTKEWAGGGGWEGKREPIVVLCRATNFLAAAVLPCWPIVNARLANRLGRLLRACSSYFLLFYTFPFIPPPLTPPPPFSLILRHHLSFSMCPPRLLCCKLVRVRRHLLFIFMIRKTHLAKPIIKKRRSRRL
jgi:hypothetical protein